MTYCNDTDAGEKVNYRCNKVKKNGPQCPAAMYLLYHADRLTVSLFRTDADHDHMDANQWESAVCTCPIYLKQHICKHVLGVAIQMGWTEAPPQATKIPLGQNRKRGRPRLAGPALQRESDSEGSDSE